MYQFSFFPIEPEALIMWHHPKPTVDYVAHPHFFGYEAIT